MFLGLAGSGKDTQADLICDLCDGIKISTGILAREEIKKNTKLGGIADRYMKKGLLIPDDVIHEILRSGLKNIDSERLWAFTGAVKTYEQVSMLDDTLSIFGKRLQKVIYIELSDSSIINRLSKRRFCPKCGATYHTDYKKSKKNGICDIDGHSLEQREDDNPKVIRTRIIEDKNQIRKVLEEYDSRGILLRVDGEPTIDQIHKDLVKKLSNEG